jgi:hypothetical protein
MRNFRTFEAFALIAALFAMSGCSSQKKVIAGDGESAIKIDCSGRLQSWDMCYEKLAKSCASMGYEILRSSLDGNEIRGKESDQRTIIARCKK